MLIVKYISVYKSITNFYLQFMRYLTIIFITVYKDLLFIFALNQFSVMITKYIFS